MTDEQIIIAYLEGGEWRCVWNAYHIKDDRARISGINRKYKAGKIDFWIEGTRCDFRCGTQHESGIYMRRLVERPKSPVTPPFARQTFSPPTGQVLMKTSPEAKIYDISPIQAVFQGNLSL